MKYLQYINQLAWQQIYKTTHLENNSLSSFRLIFALFFILLYIPDYFWLKGIPDAFYRPPIFSIANFFNGFPDFSVIIFLYIILVFSLMLVVWKKYMKLSGVLVFFTFIILSNIAFGIGKINHSILLPISFLILSLANWKSTGKNSFLSRVPPIALIAVVLTFGMLTAGIPKALYWIDFDLNQSGFLSWFYPKYFVEGRDGLLMNMVFSLPPIILELMDYSAVFIEVISIFLLFSGNARAWKIWIITLIVFHIANILVLNIGFDSHFVVYLLFFMTQKVNLFIEKYEKVLSGFIVLIGVTQLYLIIFTNQTIRGLIFPEFNSRMYFSLVILSLALIFVCFQFFNRKEKIAN